MHWGKFGRKYTPKCILYMIIYIWSLLFYLEGVESMDQRCTPCVQSGKPGWQDAILLHVSTEFNSLIPQLGKDEFFLVGLRFEFRVSHPKFKCGSST
jgi:hypothetical protein